MTQSHLEELNTILTKKLHICLSDTLTLEDQVQVSEIIANLCHAIASLSYIKEKDNGEGWKGS